MSVELSKIKIKKITGVVDRGPVNKFFGVEASAYWITFTFEYEGVTFGNTIDYEGDLLDDKLGDAMLQHALDYLRNEDKRLKLLKLVNARWSGYCG